MALESDDVGPGWDGFKPAPKGGGKRNDGLSLFMRLEPREEPYHFRLACTPIRFRKHRWAFRSLKQYPISPATDQSEKDLDMAWKDGKFMPVLRGAAFVFDRDNGNRLRILEEGTDVFGPIYNDAYMNKINPASPTKGGDWIVLVQEDAQKKRTYQVAFDRNKGATPFTDEEIKALENPKFQRSELETRYFAKSTPEEIKDLFEQLPIGQRLNQPRDGKGKQDGQKASQPVSKAASQATAAPVAAQPVAQPAEPPPDPVEPEPTEAGSGDEETARMF